MSKALSRRIGAVSIDQSISDLASRINEICSTATLDQAYRVGEIVISGLYKGSLDTWAQEGTRCLSYRKLAQQGDLPPPFVKTFRRDYLYLARLKDTATVLRPLGAWLFAHNEHHAPERARHAAAECKSCALAQAA